MGVIAMFVMIIAVISRSQDTRHSRDDCRKGKENARENGDNSHAFFVFHDFLTTFVVQSITLKLSLKRQ